ncbi:MAG: chromate efflux transporter [Deltaproteobacteria bacterium]|nr:chromate efflux transporter [Deltaproteobacteria bacterium]
MFPLSLLFKKFLKLGATAYGGPAIAQQMKKTIVKDLGWLKESEFMQGIALCQLIPGATFVQMSSYIGYRLRGIWGAFICALAFIIPAFILIVILSAIYFTLGNLWFIQSLFKGLGAMVVAIVLNAVINFGRPLVKDWKMVLIAILSFFGFLFHLNTVLVFLLAAVLALILRPAIAAKTPPGPPGQGIGETAKRRGDSLFLIVLAALIGAIFVVCYWLNPKLSYLALTLSKIGALAFGGGFTIIPLIQYEVVDHFGWVSTKEFLDGIAMGQVTPGPIMITATFLGYKIAGFWGALMATMAIFSPAFFIVTLLIPHYDRLKGLGTVRMIEQGILASFVGMLCLVLYNFGKTTFVDIPSVIFTAAAFIALFKKIDLSYVLITGAVLSIIIFGFLM